MSCSESEPACSLLRRSGGLQGGLANCGWGMLDRARDRMHTTCCSVSIVGALWCSEYGRILGTREGCR
jgi:hypothetical protein